jgi:hypothetical protein
MLGEEHRDDTKLLEEQLSWTAKEVHDEFTLKNPESL